MDRAKDVTPIGAPAARAARHEAAVEEPGPGPGPGPVRRGAPGMVAALSLAIQLCLVAVVAVAAYFIAGGTAELSAQVRAASEKAASASERVGELGAQTEALKAEVVDLRHALASGTSEDVLFLKIILLEPKIDHDLARTIAASVHRNAMTYEKDPNLVLAIISVESRFNPKAVSSSGALGLMQVMPHWKKVLAIQGDLTDPEISIRYGLQILGFYEGMYRDLETVLTAYNRGPGPVDKALMRNVSPTNDYAPRVMATYERLRKLNVASSAR